MLVGAGGHFCPVARMLTDRGVPFRLRAPGFSTKTDAAAVVVAQRPSFQSMRTRQRLRSILKCQSWLLRRPQRIRLVLS
jgi:hypothetical protein